MCIEGAARARGAHGAPYSGRRRARIAHASRRTALILASATVLAAIGACASSVPPAEFRRSEQRLEAARLVASLECTTPRDCDDRWTRTRAFIDERSATPVSSVSASAIETGEPHQFGVVYLRAERVAAADGVTVIRLKGMCRGMYDTDGGPGPLYRGCAKQIYDAALDYRRRMGGAQ